MNKYQSNKFLMVFSNCVPVRGLKRSILYDLQRSHYDLIPNDMYDLLINGEHSSLDEIYQSYAPENHSVLDEYFEFLVSSEYVFFLDSREECQLFPKIDFSFETFHKLNNAIIEINLKSKEYDVVQLIAELEDLNCKDVELRLVGTSTIYDLNEVLPLFGGTCIQNINLLIKYSPELKANISGITGKHLRLNSIIMYEAPNNSILENDTYEIILSTKTLSNNIHCGNIQSSYFRVNMDVYKETLSYNNCLNGKVYIDTYGNVKNCPSTAMIYGNVNQDKLSKILEQTNLTEMWTIRKDQVQTCRDCEFRFICSDCRAYLKDPHDLYSQPLKCGYDPSSGLWEEWSTNENSKKGIGFYQMGELVKENNE